MALRLIWDTGGLYHQLWKTDVALYWKDSDSASQPLWVTCVKIIKDHRLSIEHVKPVQIWLQLPCSISIILTGPDDARVPPAFRWKVYHNLKLAYSRYKYCLVRISGSLLRRTEQIDSSPGVNVWHQDYYAHPWHSAIGDRCHLVYLCLASGLTPAQQGFEPSSKVVKIT